MDKTVKLIPAKDCKPRGEYGKEIIAVVPRPTVINDVDDLWVDVYGFVYVVIDNVAHMLLGYRFGKFPPYYRVSNKRRRWVLFDEETKGTEFELGDQLTR